ncbi:MAG: NADH-quinone oxidoreductase subunit C [Candidatus Thermoplasmatota archaeon]|nr:NADH-quinone oxidoreductase subunit C [Candidatus Thermoplasmatota archaeon]MCL5681351.1 NADH-quinone oxidoreductase subunit C [Candidatus Thermoplasmatota archaeon]
MIPIESEGTSKDGTRTVYVAKENILAFMKERKDEGFDVLLMITGIDYKDHLEVVYHLLSTTNGNRLVVKTKTDEEVDSMTGLWAGANWHERETWDLVGIKFKGHPNLKRLLLAEGWVGHPLRKDYPLDKKQFVNLGEDGEDRVSFDPREGY